MLFSPSGAYKKYEITFLLYCKKHKKLAFTTNGFFNPFIFLAPLLLGINLVWKSKQKMSF
jgi:hypothetical protein